MDQQQVCANVSLFREMIRGSADICLWRYDEAGNLLESDCPNEAIFSVVFSAFGCLDIMYEHSREYDVPLTLSTPLGLSWFAGFQKETGELRQAYVFGPFFTADVSFHSIERAMNQCPELNVSAAWKQELARILDQVPTISNILLIQYQVMLHYCITGQHIRGSDIGVPRSREPQPDGQLAERDRHKVWVAEQQLLRTVREGDLNYRDALKNCNNLSDGIPVDASDYLRQAKDTVIVSISLCARAAIEGGLSPEQAYSLGDTYIQGVEDCRSTGDIAAIHNTMIDDFVHRVHRCRTNPALSRQIRQCCDYIETHTEEELSIAALAQKAGYTEYYLSRKFKAETHIPINDYIKITRIERAKFLLKTTDESIQKLADRLHFCTRSHFGEVFRKLVGCSPVEYRENG